MSTSENMPPELAQIAAEAAAIEPAETQIDEQGQPIAEAVPVDYLVDARGITDILATSLGAIYPRTEKVLTDETRGKFAAALAPVMEKYGFSLGSVFGRWGAEINLAFVVAGMAVPLSKAIAEDRAIARASKPAEQSQRPVVDQSDSENLAGKV